MVLIDKLVAFIEYEFNGRVHAKFHTEKRVKHIIFSLLNCKDTVIQTIDSSTNSCTFHNLSPDSYHVVAEVFFCSGETQKYCSCVLNVEYHLANKIFNLLHCSDQEVKFSFGHKYVHKHTLYDNVNFYRLEVGFDPNGGYEKYMNLPSKLSVKRCYSDEECTGPKGNHYRHIYYVEPSIGKEYLIDYAQRLDSYDFVLFTSITPLEIVFNPLKGEKIAVEKPYEKQGETPNFQELQTYLLDGQKGFNVEEAWELGAHGDYAICQVSNYGWFPHEDFDDNILPFDVGGNDPHCGVNTAGVVVASNNAKGVKGMAHRARYLVRDSTFGIAADIQSAPGEIIGLNPTLLISDTIVPVTANLGLWIRINKAAEANVLVFVNAGSSDENLSESTVFTDHGDSGAILVGSIDPHSGNRGKKSNYNHYTIKLHGWDRGIATTGSGLLFNKGQFRTYTHEFGNTAGALAQNLGAACLIVSELLRQELSMNAWEFMYYVRYFSDHSDVEKGVGVRINVGKCIKEIKKWADCRQHV